MVVVVVVVVMDVGDVDEVILRGLDIIESLKGENFVVSLMRRRFFWCGLEFQLSIITCMSSSPLSVFAVKCEIPIRM